MRSGERGRQCTCGKEVAACATLKGGRGELEAAARLWSATLEGVVVKNTALLGERERAHLVVQLGRAVCIYIYICIYVFMYLSGRVPDTVNF